MSLSDFQILSKLGDGSYSSVYKVMRIEDSQEYALKKVKMINLSDREKENALNEVRILASIKHKNVASYKQAFFDEPSSSLCIVMEYADNGDVFQKICEHQQSGVFIKEKIIWKVFIQAVRGLKALHDLKILHRDMKSANIFLYKNYVAKLGDLNVSKVAKKGLLYTQTGTPYYASPEVWKDQPYDHKSDIWSLGCVLYEMCSLVPPFRADDMNGLYKKILKGQYPQIPSHYSMDLRNVIKSLIQVNASSRPNCDQILEMQVISRRAKKYLKDENLVGARELETESELLKTIKFSRNIFKLKLPQATYEQLQFATMPAHVSKSKSRNQGNVAPSSKTMSIVQQQQNLPKITTQSNRNQNNMSMLNKSINSGDGDDEYEQDFEQDDSKAKIIITNQAQQIKTRSKSEKKIDIRNINNNSINNSQKSRKPVLAPIEIKNDQGSNENLNGVVNTTRSKSTLNEDAISQAPQITITKASPRNQNSSESLSSIKKNQSQSPRQSVMSMQNNKAATSDHQSIHQSRSKKQLSRTIDINENSIQGETIEEKEELEDDSEATNENQRQRSERKKTNIRISLNANINLSNSKQQSNQTNQKQLPPIIQQDENDYGLNSKANDSTQSLDLSTSQAYKQKEDRKNYHLPPAPRQEQNKVVSQLSQSPSSISIAYQDQSPNPRYQNSLDRNQSRELIPATMQNKVVMRPNKNSPNLQRVVSIYSINKGKKLKNGPPGINVNTGNQVNSNVFRLLDQRDDEIKLKLQQLREGIGYYESNSGVGSNNLSIDRTSRNQNNHSVLLPELKSINSQISNVRQHYHNLNSGNNSYNDVSSVSNGNAGSRSKMTIDSKRNYDRLVRIDNQLHTLQRKQNGKIEITNRSILQQPQSLRIKQKIQKSNYSGIGNELDIQGKSVINSKMILNNSGL